MPPERPADPLISCVVPAHNESGTIVLLLQELHRLLGAEGYRHELIVVDDGSRDDTVEQVLTKSAGLPVKLVQLSRNFGKEVALTAGLDHVVGDAVVLIDADFQQSAGIHSRISQALARRLRYGLQCACQPQG